MKNSLFNVLVFVFISFLIFPKTTLISQCEFVAAESSDPVLTDYSATNIHLNLVFHIIRKSDGSGTTTFSDIYAYLDCLSPLKDWTNIENQFSHINFRKNDKTKKTIYSGREA